MHALVKAPTAEQGLALGNVSGFETEKHDGLQLRRPSEGIQGCLIIQAVSGIAVEELGSGKCGTWGHILLDEPGLA